MVSARQAWLAAHPFLEPVARFQGIVEDAAARGPERRACVARWDAWDPDRDSGVPILRSAAAGVYLAPAAEALGDLAATLAGETLPGALGEGCREIADALRTTQERTRAIAWIVAGAPSEEAPPHAGLLRLLAWTATRRVLEPVVRGTAERCGEGRWDRGHCPTCGALPATAQLVSGESGRPRFLACALCGTRWRWRRIGCPSCGNDASDRLAIFEVEGEDALRLDVCSECTGYLKTYTEEGEEALFLADWPTLHLDVVARERGFRRVGASLYDLPGEERRTEPWPTRC